MPTLDWLRNEFSYGYSSGDVLSRVPSLTRFREERRCGTSYRNVFRTVVAPLLKRDSQVLELGPGRGSWTRALLKHLPDGKVMTIDFQDVSQWLKPDMYGGRLRCVQVQDASMAEVPDDSFDLFFSWGVLCHNNTSTIAQILRNARGKVRIGGSALHMYGDWNKLTRFGWKRGAVPTTFRDMSDDEIWWPRNDSETMARIARESGWRVDAADLDVVERDGVIRLTRTA